MGTRTMVTGLAATLAIGVLGTAAAGAETDEEMDRALSECMDAGGELVIEEGESGEMTYYCMGGDDEIACGEKIVQVDGDRWACVYLDRDFTVVVSPDPLTTTGGYGGAGTISEPATRPALTLASAPVRRLG